MRMITTALLIAACLAACALAPSEQELAAADYGAPITSLAAQEKAHQFFAARVPDPALERFTEPEKGWWWEEGEVRYGYSMGFSLSRKRYRAFYRNGILMLVLELPRSSNRLARAMPVH